MELGWDLGWRGTALLLAAAVALFLYARHRFEHPADLPPEPGRLLPPPWLGLMMLAALVALVALAHMVSLGTGTPLVGRWE